ncbi:TRAP transporter substrate-binding protein [Celeribacter halophilus]|uniref:TRAP transporter substrate-binding protein n=1 Tax=Celeribacter halophilus TaxID=576117 RepID=UPI0026E49388|nr:TRAP transporter substrate-binding protein [Celeribacter halophilus]MDO6725164.1 TRAP transporter substrate-binding protein [Celeribacter halophilus]
MNVSKVILSAVVVGTIGSAALAETEFSLSYFVGPKHRFNEAFFTPLAENLEDLSSGALTIKQYGGGTLNSNPALQYSTVVEGVSDMAFGISSYTYDLFPISSAVSVPGICNTGVDCTEALWRAQDLIEGEFNAKLIAMWSNEPMAIVSKDRPITRLEDFQGLKIRVSSNIEADFLSALGASPVSQSVSEINQNLANGTIDAIAIDPTSVRDFKLYEPANYVTLGMPTSGLAFWILMNNETYDGLTEEEKAWVDAAGGRELSVAGAHKTQAMADAALETAREAGVEILTMSPEEAARISEAFAPALAEFKAQDFNGVSGAEIFAAMKGE